MDLMVAAEKAGMEMRVPVEVVEKVKVVGEAATTV